MAYRITPKLQEKINHYAKFPQTGVSLRQMVMFGQNPSQGTLFRASQFLSDELPIRLARRVKELDDLPHHLSEMPSIIKVKNWYAQSFAIDEVDWPPEIRYYNEKFTKLIEGIKKRIIEYKIKRDKNIIDVDVQSFLDRQHVALNRLPSRSDYVGIICTKTNIGQAVQEAADNAKFICEEYYGLFNAPEIQLYCPDDLNFTYIPTHLSHMLFELLKNSLRAVVEFSGDDADEYPPIKIIVSKGQEDITIKISDEGGGIPRSSIPLVWTYMYTTAQAKALDPDFNQKEFRAPMAGYGYGLPISRLYARYFGGDLKLISMEGVGENEEYHELDLRRKNGLLVIFKNVNIYR
ncbi:6000_t:CDS:2 [Entrophospora sp. SA101]|nr:13118_t:CDS:2 [Entrophospora sp. SA101]CAJ0749639.1 6000_t:CDS:2 [Entrophospora sp. SA101]CAJ0874901.1 3518_t:CDS:2 [Entrophospora sp. SA101]